MVEVCWPGLGRWNILDSRAPWMRKWRDGQVDRRPRFAMVMDPGQLSCAGETQANAELQCDKRRYLVADRATVIRVRAGGGEFAINEHVSNEVRMNSDVEPDRGANPRNWFGLPKFEDGQKHVGPVNSWTTDELSVRVQLVVGIFGLWREVVDECAPVAPSIRSHGQEHRRTRGRGRLAARVALLPARAELLAALGVGLFIRNGPAGRGRDLDSLLGGRSSQAMVSELRRGGCPRRLPNVLGCDPTFSRRFEDDLG